MAYKKFYSLKKLDCAHCAAKIEERIKKETEVKSAVVNFPMSTLLIEFEAIEKAEEIFEKIKTIISNLEPDVIVTEIKENEIHSHCDCNKCHECCHSHEREHNHTHHTIAEINVKDEEEDESPKKEITNLIFSFITFLTAIYAQKHNLPNNLTVFLYIVSYLICGGSVLLTSFKHIKKGNFFDENLLMSIASLGACYIGEYKEGFAVMLFYKIGEICEDVATGRSKKSIASLMSIRPDYANIVNSDGQIDKVSPEQLKIGDTIIVKAGERVPLDGTILEGSSSVDTSAITGESVPRNVGEGEEILSGYINQNSPLKIKVSKTFGDSAVSRIIKLVSGAGNKKAKIENFITRFARYYTPIVIALSVIVAALPPIILSQPFSKWFYRALIFLVCSCPCALVLSIPLTFFCGIGVASKNGILVKGSTHLELLKDLKTIVFDKTGTLTNGTFSVTEIIPAKGTEINELLQLAVTAENLSNHPIAVSIRNKAKELSIQADSTNETEELAGKGIYARVNDKTIIIGNSSIMESKNIKYETCYKNGTIVYIAENNVYKGCLVISDTIKSDSNQSIRNIKELGVSKVVILTGDNKTTGEAVAKELDINHVYTNLLPEQKVEIVENLLKELKESEKLSFVGDGINDAPVLARADIGIAMGGLGSDAAIEAADIILMKDELSKIEAAIKISNKVNSVVWQNIVFSIGVKIAVMVFGAIGIANMWGAVFADVGMLILAVLNSLRILNYKTE